MKKLNRALELALGLVATVASLKSMHTPDGEYFDYLPEGIEQYIREAPQAERPTQNGGNTLGHRSEPSPQDEN